MTHEGPSGGHAGPAPEQSPPNERHASSARSPHGARCRWPDRFRSATAVEALLDRPALSFARWVDDHSDELSPAACRR